MDIRFDDIILWEGHEKNGYKYLCRVDKISGSNWVLRLIKDFSNNQYIGDTLYMPVDQSGGRVALWI